MRITVGLDGFMILTN